MGFEGRDEGANAIREGRRTAKPRRNCFLIALLQPPLNLLSMPIPSRPKNAAQQDIQGRLVLGFRDEGWAAP